MKVVPVERNTNRRDENKRQMSDGDTEEPENTVACDCSRRTLPAVCDEGASDEAERREPLKPGLSEQISRPHGFITLPPHPQERKQNIQTKSLINVIHFHIVRSPSDDRYKAQCHRVPMKIKRY